MKTDTSFQVAGAATGSASCVKCGCDDIYRKYYDAGKDTNGPSPKRDRKSTEWVDRSDAWVQPAIKDCIVHVCRCCGYQWDSDPLPNVELRHSPGEGVPPTK